MLEQKRWQTIRSYPTVIEAELARTKLESQDIECFLHDTFLLSINSFLTNALGGVRLDVKPEDAERAIAVLDDVSKP